MTKRISIEEEIKMAREMLNNMTEEEKIEYSEKMFNLERRYQGSHKATTWKRKYANRNKK